MHIIEVKIRDQKSGAVVLERKVNSKDPQKAAEKLSKSHPNNFVTVSWTDKQLKSISLSPFNMRLDEELVGSGDMNVNDFIKKWYPGKKAKSLDVIKELQDEFGEEDLL